MFIGLLANGDGDASVLLLLALLLCIAVVRRQSRREAAKRVEHLLKVKARTFAQHYQWVVGCSNGDDTRGERLFSIMFLPSLLRLGVNKLSVTPVPLEEAWKLESGAPFPDGNPRSIGPRQMLLQWEMDPESGWLILWLVGYQGELGNILLSLDKPMGQIGYDQHFQELMLRSREMQITTLGDRMKEALYPKGQLLELVS